MNLFNRWKKIKREENSLSKNFYLTSKDVAYRLAMENYSYDRRKIPLQTWYSSLGSTKSSRDKYFFANMISFFCLILSNLGALDDIEYNGIGIAKQFLTPSLFLFYSFSLMIYCYFQSKLKRFEDIFHSIYEKSSHSEKFDLILSYPDAFNALQFNPFIAGNPKHMFPARDYPIRLILLIILTLLMTLPWIAMTIWVIFTSTINIYEENYISWEWFGIAVNIASWSSILCASLLTTNEMKRKYTHYGLVNLIGKIEPNSDRYVRAMRRINTARTEK